MQNIVIVGFGFMGGMHAQVYSRLKRARVVAVVDTRVAEAASAAAKLGLNAPIFADLDWALAEGPVDVIDICLPTPAHGPWVRRAIRARKHVFCEKPFASSFREASSLAAAARRAGVRMQIGQCVRFWPEYQAFEAVVRAGRMGRLLSLTLQRRSSRPMYSSGDWLNQSGLSGGAVLDLHIHDTDYVHHLLGRPKAVTSVGTRDRSGWSHIFTTYHFDRIAVTAEGGWNYPAGWGFQMAFQAVFERGAVEYDSAASPTLMMTGTAGAKKPLAFSQPGIGDSAGGVGNIASLGGYYNELAYFVNCLEKGRSPRVATPRQAAESVRTVMAEIKSARTGRRVGL